MPKKRIKEEGVLYVNLVIFLKIEKKIFAIDVNAKKRFAKEIHLI